MAAKVVALGISLRDIANGFGLDSIIVTPFIRDNTIFKLSITIGESTCNVNCAIVSFFTNV